MLVRDICTTDVVTATRTTSVVDAARRMRERHAGDLVVLDDDERDGQRPAGIVTDRDLVITVLAQAAERAAVLTIGDVMPVRDLVVVRDDAELTHALEAMWHAAVRRVPVVDFAGLLRGVLSVDDVIVVLADAENALARLLRAQPGRERRERT